MFKRWTDAADVNTLSDLSNLILREQFLNSVCTDLATYIKERNLNDFADVVTAAEAYRIAHPGINLAANNSETTWNLSATSVLQDCSRPRQRSNFHSITGSRNSDRRNVGQSFTPSRRISFSNRRYVNNPQKKFQVTFKFF